MPTIDGGHLFITCLVPVQLGEFQDGDLLVTHSHKLREELSLLPKAQQSAVNVQTGLMSPFALCHRTHFLRLFVIDQPMFNGRDPSNPLLASLTGKTPLVHQPYDTLTRPWLVLATDVDRREAEPDEGMASWAEGLWTRTEPEMRAIFSHCHGFDAVNSAADFAAYLRRCQLDTTMSFNDYWQGRPPLKGLTFGALGRMVLGVAAIILLLSWWLVGPNSLWALLWLIPGVLLGIGFAAWRLNNLGQQPYPAAPDSDLPSVLKSLYIQQRFASFAEAMQGMDAATIYNSFGGFLGHNTPETTAKPSQPPGVIRADGVGLAIPESLRPGDASPERVGLEAVVKESF